jgi:thiol-disulfide isomerase/thioredoxin
MTKRIYSVLCASVFLFISPLMAQQKQGIAIKGTVAFQNPEVFKKYNMVWLYKGIEKGKVLIDSAKVNSDGTFQLKAKLLTPGLLTLDILKWQTAVFWSDQDVTIQARGYDTGKHKMKNSGYVQVESKSASTQLINLALYNQYLANEEMDFLAEEGVAAQQNFKQDNAWLTWLKTAGPGKRKQAIESLRLKHLINANQQNPAIVFLLKLLPPDQETYFTEQLDKLMLTYPQLSEAKQLKQEYLAQQAIKNAIKIGSPIPRIAYKDPEGNPIDIASFKGKYVLIDFWASWCGPCRKAIPSIKELYGQYNAKGFEVLSVSVDHDANAWRKAMEDEKMPWSQVLSPDKDKTLKEFMIIGIPTLYLINREGVIVDKYTGFSAKLKNRLDEIFKD